MAREIICVHCQQIIEEDGLITEGEAIHNNCLWDRNLGKREVDCVKLHELFEHIDTDTLDDLYEEFVMEGTFDTVDELIKALNSKWVVITRGLDSNDNGEIGFETFPSKTKACKWIAETMKDNFDNDGANWELIYILNEGKLAVGWNQFTIKVIF